MALINQFLPDIYPIKQMNPTKKPTTTTTTKAPAMIANNGREIGRASCRERVSISV